ncbi:MAG: reverse transcriptase domain-containing protein, partial [Candidatus Thiodiazotropha sp.]
TKDTSPTCGSLLLTEAIAESVDLGKPLYTAFIDASKAFDVVWHDSMLVKLYDVGLTGQKWNFLNNWYTGLQSSVKWEGANSLPFPERQGVRQGGIWSPTGYKHFLNPFLDCLMKHKVGLCIGSIYLGVVGVADDLLFMADTPEELQCQLNLQWSFAGKERYQVSDTKTKTMQHNVKNQAKAQFSFCENKLEDVQSYKHLGLIRESNNKLSNNLLIDDRIKTARNTAYALMGAGFHGLNGVNPEVSICIWQIYVRPRLLYGLESINLSKSDVQKLEVYQRTILRQILHLPERVASSAIYVLSGQLPVEAEIHKRRLALYGNIVRKDCIERELAYRQLALKDSASKSWFISLQEILYRYGLPNAQELLDSPPEKIGWKVKVRQHVNQHWQKIVIQEAENKSTLEFLNIASYTPGKVHPVWTKCKHNANSLLKAYAQVKLMCGTYILQSLRAKFNQYQVSMLCPLCKRTDETLQHFILHCDALRPARQSFMDTLHKLVGCTSDEKLFRVILDPSVACLPSGGGDESCSTRIYSLTRSLCYALHVQRNTLLASS